MEKKKKRSIHPIWFLIIGILFLIIPTGIYLGFLIPKMREEYVVLMASGGALGSAGITACSFIPETAKFGTLYKTASKSFTMLVVTTLVKDFVPQLIGLAVVLVISYIIFVVFKELWKNGKQKKQNINLAEEISRSIAETTK